MIQVTRNRVIAAEDDFDALRKEFDQRQTVEIPGLIEEGLLRELLDKLENTTFLPKTEGAMGDEFGEILHVRQPNLRFSYSI